jgi:large subunit ribosomal protein L43
VCVRNFESKDILDKVEYFKQSSGEKLKKQRKPVTSVNESVRGIWSPYHGDLKMV